MSMYGFNRRCLTEKTPDGSILENALTVGGPWKEQGGSNGSIGEFHSRENDKRTGMPYMPSSVCGVSLAELGI